MRKHACSLVFILAGCFVGYISPAAAKESGKATPMKASAAKKPIVMRPADIMVVEAQIVGGSLLKRAEWPATLNFALNAGNVCTATLIGPRVVLTAAHCLDDGAKATVELANRNIAIECNHHPDYDKVSLEADIALCHATNDIPFNAFERVSFEPVGKNEGRLFLLGYGCTDVHTLKGGGRLYGGYSSIASITDAHVVTERGPGSVQICPGDSGGAAFKLLVSEQHQGARYIIGVNSGYSIDKKELSYIARLSTYKPFVTEWLNAHSATICDKDSVDLFCR